MLTDHKQPVALFKKVVTSLSYRLQIVLLHIHQYSIRIECKPGPQLFIADWLSRHSHKKGTDKEIPGLGISIKVIETCMNIPECMTVEEI